jgi:hypothetical protein
VATCIAHEAIERRAPFLDARHPFIHVRPALLCVSQLHQPLGLAKFTPALGEARNLAALRRPRSAVSVITSVGQQANIRLSREWANFLEELVA